MQIRQISDQSPILKQFDNAVTSQPIGIDMPELYDWDGLAVRSVSDSRGGRWGGRPPIGSHFCQKAAFSV